MLDRARKIPRLIRSLRAAGPGSARFYAMVQLGRRLLPEYRFRWLHLDWRKDADFNAYLARFDHPSSPDAGRRWTVHQLLRLVAAVPGDTAECGVYTGGMSYLIAKANAHAGQPRHHYMFDSFEGLSAPATADGRYWTASDLTAGEDLVLRNMAGCRDFTLMRGWIPARFPEVASREFAFVHIDVDLYEPTRDSLAFFYPRMRPGGIIVVDDFGFSTCPGATRACHEVLAGKPEQMIALPDGGGFLIKGCATGTPADLASEAPAGAPG